MKFTTLATLSALLWLAALSLLVAALWTRTATGTDALAYLGLIGLSNAAWRAAKR